MKVRDIKTYIEGYCKDASIERLGTDAEPFLSTIHGFGQRIDETVKNVARFARDSEEQLFYEFVQNAFDAKADSLCFFFDKDYLIVLNNGEPFYTDAICPTPRDGQLYNFLAKGKSLKAGDESKSGEFGQGSKLLYNLIADRSIASNRDLLLKAIKESRKGPYLVSWGSPDQLSDFRLLDSGNWTYTNPHQDPADLLVCKILMTYFPIAPGVDEALFSRTEFDGMRAAFERLVDPKRNINRLKTGSAIIIPLGSGQFEAIADERNIKKVMTRLAGFTILTADKEENRGRHLDHIYINHEEVEMQHAGHSVKINFTLPDTEGSFSYHFVFNPAFVKDEMVTLFKTLPITEARYRMGFIIDSQNFEHDDSRQRINDTRKTGLQMREAFKRLLEKVINIRQSDLEQFDYIYRSILATDLPKEREDSLFISQPFYETFLPYIKEHVKTREGNYVPLDAVRVPEEKKMPDIPLDKLGLGKYHWLSADITKGQLQRFGIRPEVLSLKDILREADDRGLSDWIGGLGLKEYNSLHGEFLALSQKDEEIAGKHLFLTNKDNVYSYNELLSPENPAILYEDEHAHLDRCLEIEHVLGPISIPDDDTAVNVGTVNIRKITAQIQFFRDGSSRADAACQILLDASRYERTLQAIRKNIPLLMRQDGSYHPFCEMVRERPEGTILFDYFRVCGHVPENFPDEFFASTSEDLWEWLKSDLKSFLKLPDWEEHHERYLKDIISIFKAAGSPYPDRLPIYLNASGIPTDGKLFHLIGDNNLLEDQYHFVSEFAESRGYRLVPFKFRKILASAPFETNLLTLNELINNTATIDDALLQSFANIAGADIFNDFTIEPLGGGKYKIAKLTRGHRNYTCRIEDFVIDTVLDIIGYKQIVPEVCRFFHEGLDEYELTTNNQMMASVLEHYPKEKQNALLWLLPVVKVHNEAINRSYYNHLPVLPVDSPLEESNPIWQVILYALERRDDDDFYRDSLLRLITHKGKPLPETIKADTIHFNGTDYNLYELLEEVKVENELVDSFFNCLPNPELFRKRVYSDSEEATPPEDIYDTLHRCYLTISQLRFCLDYSLSKHPDYHELELAEKESLAEALDMISSNGFAGFDEYFIIPGFDKDEQVYAPEELLLETEHLPEALRAWIDKNQERAFGLQKGLKNGFNANITLRQSLKENSAFSDFDSVVADEDFLSRTIDWIIRQKFSISLLDTRFNILKELLDRLPDRTEPVPALRFTPDFTKEAVGIRPAQIISFEYLDDRGSLISFENVYNNSDRIRRKPQLKEFFGEGPVYGYDGANANYLLKQELNDMPRFAIRMTAKKKDYQEWGAKAYIQWLELKQSEGVRIFLSKEPVGIVLSIVNESTGESKVSVASRNDLSGYDFDARTVVIQHPNPEKLSEMKTLERVAMSAEFFKNPFIALQGIYVDMYEQGIDPNALDENEKKGVELAQKLGGENVDKIGENLSVIKDIVENLTAEELKTVAENKDKLRNLLEDMPDDDDESLRSKVRKTIGYIGELIYMHYLDNKKVNYIYAAEKGIGDYDFELPATDTRSALYVDVKTNLYSFKDEAVPFYIHKSQNKFMQEHPDLPFHIVRISLTDLNLKRLYEELKWLFDKEADYEENSRLRTRCQKIAKDYWRGARIEEFDAASPEYGIRIERTSRA